MVKIACLLLFRFLSMSNWPDISWSDIRLMHLYLSANYKLLGRLMLSILIIFVAAFIAKYGSESLFLNPLEKVMDVVKKVESGDMSARVSTISGVGELAALARSFDQMTDSCSSGKWNADFPTRSSGLFMITTAVGVAIMTLDRRITQVNPASVRIVGIHKKKSQRSIHQPYLLKKIGISIGNYSRIWFRGTVNSISWKNDICGKTGEMFWGSVNFSLVRD